MPQNLPNLLTGLRIAAIPLMVVCYYLPQPISTVGAAVVFIVAAVTDWFDGWVARRMGQTSQFGAFLDPVADKLLVTVALILLMHRMDNVLITLAGMVVIGREIVISALREWMAQLGKQASVAVSGIAKVMIQGSCSSLPAEHQPVTTLVTSGGTEAIQHQSSSFRGTTGQQGTCMTHGEIKAC